jgi:hypothetical protein
MAPRETTSALGFARPGVLLRTEGAVMFALSLLLYWLDGGSWVLFVLLFLAPDVSMLGYVVGTRVGAGVYNVFHTYALPAALAAYGLVGGSTVAVSVALIWFAHIGVDRMLGYGLKYSSGFKDTHLGRV